MTFFLVKPKAKRKPRQKRLIQYMIGANNA